MIEYNANRVIEWKLLRAHNLLIVLCVYGILSDKGGRFTVQW